MSEKSEQFKERLQSFKDEYALPLATGAVCGMAILVTAYAGAMHGAERAIKKAKIEVKLYPSNPDIKLRPKQD
jgi:hypothetical protein